MYPYFDKLFSKFQCSFRKGFNVQHCLITMIEKWRRSVDGGGQAVALLPDLSEAFARRRKTKNQNKFLLQCV